MSRPAPQLAYVLHRYDWSETSLILDVFTREAGRVAVAAKGAKRPYSQWRSVLLPFQRLWVSYGSRRGEGGEIVTLKSAEWAQGGAMLSGGALFSGFYLNELLMKLLARQDPSPGLFDAYAQTLPALSCGDERDESAALRAFELLLLRAVGLLPALDRVTSTQQALDVEASYTLRAEVGVSPMTPRGQGETAGVSGAVLIALEAALSENNMEALRSGCRLEWSTLKSPMRALLHYHLGHQELRTRQVLTALRHNQS